MSILWDVSFKGSPVGGGNPGTADREIRDTRLGVEERTSNEHSSTQTGSGGGVSADWLHKAGGPKAYYQAAAPTNRPDGATTFTSEDAGRLFVDSDTGEIQIRGTSAFVFPTFVSLLSNPPWLNTSTTPSDNVIAGRDSAEFRLIQPDTGSFLPPVTPFHNARAPGWARYIFGTLVDSGTGKALKFQSCFYTTGGDTGYLKTTDKDSTELWAQTMTSSTPYGDTTDYIASTPNTVLLLLKGCLSTNYAYGFAPLLHAKVGFYGKNHSNILRAINS